MSEALAILAVGSAAFAATSLDNLVLLAVLIRGERRLARPLCTGQLLASFAVAVGGLLAAEVADWVPARWVGWLGIIPVTLGVQRLLRRHSGDAAVSARSVAPLRLTGATALLLAQSGDAFAVFIPLFAETEAPWSWLLAGIVLAWSAALCALALTLARLRVLAGAIDRFGHALVPFVLIGVGAYVLFDTATDVLR